MDTGQHIAMNPLGSKRMIPCKSPLFNSAFFLFHIYSPPVNVSSSTMQMMPNPTPGSRNTHEIAPNATLPSKRQEDVTTCKYRHCFRHRSPQDLQILWLWILLGWQFAMAILPLFLPRCRYYRRPRWSRNGFGSHFCLSEFPPNLCQTIRSQIRWFCIEMPCYSKNGQFIGIGTLSAHLRKLFNHFGRIGIASFGENDHPQYMYGGFLLQYVSHWRYWCHQE